MKPCFKRCAVLFPALLAAAGLCSCQYERDRVDERVLNLSGESYTLYRHAAVPGLEKLPSAGTPFQADFRIVMRDMLTERKLPVSNDPDNCAVVSLLWGSGAPLLKLYHPGAPPSSARPDFQMPLTEANTTVLLSSPEKTVYGIVLSLRGGTFLPLLLDDKYEIFLMTLAFDAKKAEWSVETIKQLTDGKDDAVQPVLSRDAQKLVYVRLARGKTPTVFSLDLQSGAKHSPVMIAENAGLPFLFPDGQRVLYVQNALDGWSSFHVCELATGVRRPARSPEIEEAVRILPYSKLRRFYTELKNDPATPPPEEAIRRMSYREIVDYAVRNAPRVRQAYSAYVSMAAQSTQNLFDVGPDFFANADYLATSNILTNTAGDYYVIGDRIGQDNFLRGVVGLSIPVIPNLPLHWAQRSFLDWKVAEAREQLSGVVNSTIGEVTQLTFSALLYRELRTLLLRNIELNNLRQERYRVRAAADEAYLERRLYAQNIAAGLKSELNYLDEKLIGVSLRLSGAIGLAGERALFPVRKNGGQTPVLPEKSVPPLSFFLANAMVNRHELRELDCRMNQDAAVRDMGPEATRIESVRVRVSYGIGLDGWRKFVDDFLLLGLSYARPLRLPHFFQAYYARWTASINSLRMERFTQESLIRNELYELYTDFTGGDFRAVHRRSRSEYLREQSRIAELTRRYGGAFVDSPATSREDTDTGLEALTEEMTLKRAEYARWQTLIELYTRSGRADLLCSIAERALDSIEAAHDVSRRGIYLWKALEVIRSKVAREHFLAVCEKAGIDEVYCFISLSKEGVPFLETYAPEYEYFIASCRRRGIAVKALAGEPEWLDPEQRDDLRKLLESYNMFNLELQRRGAVGFSGLKLDVEPHGEENWGNMERRGILMKNYLSLLRETADTVGRENLSADVSYHYNAMPLPEKDAASDFLGAISREVGGVTVMAYLNRPDLVKNKVRPILERADLGCRVGVALETNKLKEPGLSFYGTPGTRFQTHLNDFRDDFRKYGSFSGLLIHDYNGFRSMDMEK